MLGHSDLFALEQGDTALSFTELTALCGEASIERRLLFHLIYLIAQRAWIT